MSQQKFKEVRLSKIWKHTKSNRPFALITAFLDEYDYEENVQRNTKLAAEISKQRYGFSYVEGAWIENEGTKEEIAVSEDSIFVVAGEGNDQKLLERMIAHAKAYNQDGVLVKTKEGVKIYDKQGKVKDDLGTLNSSNISETYTKLRNKKQTNTFSFESTRVAGGWIAQLLAAHKSKNT